MKIKSAFAAAHHIWVLSQTAVEVRENRDTLLEQLAKSYVTPVAGRANSTIYPTTVLLCTNGNTTQGTTN